MEKICVSEFSESTAVILFVQQYASDVFHIQKPKKLSFVKSDGDGRFLRKRLSPDRSFYYEVLIIKKK